VTFEPIAVGDLLGHPGTSRVVLVRGTLEDLSTEVATVAGEITADLLLESVVEGILVSGRLTGELSLSCARCLDPFARPFELEAHELFIEAPPPDGDDYRLGPEGSLDPGQMALDLIGVEMPFAPLCRPDCLGLCDTCGGNRNLGECPGHEEVDPRWAGLEAVLERMSD
jgi:uncharacterized protein